MKAYNSNVAKAKLRREQFNRSKNKSQFSGKKSLSKRIIAERVGGITKDNIDCEVENLGCMNRSDEVLAQIMYHIKFGMDTRPSTFDEDRIEMFLKEVKVLQTRLDKGDIDAKQYLDSLEGIDRQIMGIIDNNSRCL